MGMHCLCAKAQKQVETCEIYMAISSFFCQSQKKNMGEILYGYLNGLIFININMTYL